MVDLAPAFEAAGNDALHFDWVHPSAQGQELIASLVEPVVREALVAKGVLSDPSAAR